MFAEILDHFEINFGWVTAECVWMGFADYIMNIYIYIYIVLFFSLIILVQLYGRVLGVGYVCSHVIGSPFVFI